ncbi:hypothetical protein DVH24_027962 [Malus domestica]|uniref:Endonuclease/exonuclease/phosphatase domain-containing protein n=1 Tax=Malus domestica TaxID=3750 RepID=A0A498HED9_MALDO|nr:hypothetical protein DVH24_027962 [Malus domestica]
MKVLYWNIRGVGNRPTRRTLRSIVHKYSLDIICIAEPFVPLKRVHPYFWRSISMNLLGVNDRGLQQPNLWIFHSVQASSPKCSNQHVFVHFNLNGITHGISFVYAATTVVEHRSLWLSLAHDCSIFARPHLILGDFNAVLGAHEKIGGILPRCSSCEEFQAMVDTRGLLPIDTKGSPFTWTNGHGISSHIEMLLIVVFVLPLGMTPGQLLIAQLLHVILRTIIHF